LKLSGAYWCIGALKMMKVHCANRREEMIQFVKGTQQQDGGFGGNIGHDSNI
jgi:geranylgeranyl transferase type-2 subunit beta